MGSTQIGPKGGPGLPNATSTSYRVQVDPPAGYSSIRDPDKLNSIKRRVVVGVVIVACFTLGILLGSLSQACSHGKPEHEGICYMDSIDIKGVSLGAAGTIYVRRSSVISWKTNLTLAAGKYDIKLANTAIIPPEICGKSNQTNIIGELEGSGADKLTIKDGTFASDDNLHGHQIQICLFEVCSCCIIVATN